MATGKPRKGGARAKSTDSLAAYRRRWHAFSGRLQALCDSTWWPSMEAESPPPAVVEAADLFHAADEEFLGVHFPDLDAVLPLIEKAEKAWRDVLAHRPTIQLLRRRQREETARRKARRARAKAGAA